MNYKLKSLALKIDKACQQQDETELNSLIKQCDLLLESNIKKYRPVIFFYKANCHACLSHLRTCNREYDWNWQKEDSIAEVLNLKSAITDANFDNLDVVIKCKILTNLGNIQNHLGRMVEAIQYWNLALEIIPYFAMALGNKGMGLTHYAKSLYDEGHTYIILYHAQYFLIKSLSKDMFWDSGTDPNAKNGFNYYLTKVDEHLILFEHDVNPELGEWSLGDSQNEIDYRKWCLKNVLFLSPLNDITQHSVSAHDIFHLPSHHYLIDEDARFPKYFNIMKQEYITARYLLFESYSDENKHISDKDVMLSNTFDGVRYSYKNEQLKTSFRLAYSIFDKVALFLNDYFGIGLKPHKVSFRRVWGEPKKGKIEVYPCFQNSANLPLRGLYYLSKDFFDDDFKDVALPEAQKLSELRNFIEHRFLSLQEYDAKTNSTINHLYITVENFQLKTLKILSLAREALIYLSLAMHREEQIRNTNK